MKLKESVQGIKLIEAYIGYRKALNEENKAREEFISENKELIEMKTKLEKAKEAEFDYNILNERDRIKKLKDYKRIILGYKEDLSILEKNVREAEAKVAALTI